MIRGLLFDFGGTLDSDGIHWSEKFFDLYTRLKLPVSKPDYERAYVAAEKKMGEITIAPSEQLRDTLHKQVSFQLEFLVSSEAIASSEVPELAEKLAGEAYHDVLASIAAVKPLLVAFGRDYRLALVSNFTGNLETVTRELGIDRLLNATVDSTVVGVSKPDPGIFIISAQRLGYSPADCVMIGDSYDRDIEPAAALGMKTIFLHGRSWKEPTTIERADEVITSIHELPAALERLKARS